MLTYAVVASKGTTYLLYHMHASVRKPPPLYLCLQERAVRLQQDCVKLAKERDEERREADLLRQKLT